MKKTTFCVCIFNISHYVFTQIMRGRAHWMQNLIPHPTITYNAYFEWTPLPPKQEMSEKTWWWHRHHVFLGISYFWGSEVHQKYAVWVLVGCRIKFHIQQSLSLRILVKAQGDMSKIQTQKVVFVIFPPKLITIILLFSLGGHFRPQISSNVNHAIKKIE